MSTRHPVLLLVNPNTNGSTTRMMRDLAAAELSETGPEVVGMTALQGPRMLVGPEDLAASGEYVQEVVRTYLAGPHGSDVAAVMVAAMGDPGRRELGNELGFPVVGIGEAGRQPRTGGTLEWPPAPRSWWIPCPGWYLNMGGMPSSAVCS